MYSFTDFDPSKSLKPLSDADFNSGLSFTGTLLAGQNPFSVKGVGTSSSIFTALTVLDLFSSSKPRSLYSKTKLLNYRVQFFPKDSTSDLNTLLNKKILKTVEMKQLVYHFNPNLTKKAATSRAPANVFTAKLDQGSYKFGAYIKASSEVGANAAFLKPLLGYKPYLKVKTIYDSYLYIQKDKSKAGKYNFHITPDDYIADDYQATEGMLLQISTIPGLVLKSKFGDRYYYDGSMYTREEFVAFSEGLQDKKP